MISRHASTTLSAGCLLLAGGILVWAFAGGCGGKEDPAPDDGGSPKVEPLLDGWEKPAFALVVSGEQNGFIEPCGCTAENQLGGLAHRADLFRIIGEEKKWDVAALDLGGLIKRTRTQDRIKLAKTLDGLLEMGYRAVGIGLPELKLAVSDDPDFVLTLPGMLADDDQAKLPFVAANVDYSEVGPRKWSVFEVGGKRIGVTAVVGKQTSYKVLPSGSNGRLTLTDAGEALKKAGKELKAQKPDYLVLMCYGTKEEADRLAKDFPDFNLIATTGGLEKSWTVGETLLINVGTQGKHVGVVGYYPDAEQKSKFELVELDAVRFKNDPRMHDLMADYQQRLFDRRAEVFADSGFGPHPSGKTYVGVENCKDCHTKAYAKWKTTKHAHAYESLIKGRKDVKEWVPRNHDPECLACHTTGWEPQEVKRYDSGYLLESLAESRRQPQLYTHLKGQQCENCHGPGSRHVELERQWRDAPKSVDDAALRTARVDMQMRKEQVEKSNFCMKCHDLDNSPKFDFATYWREVEHKGKD